MNTTIHKSWNTGLYLDALGSASVIAASVLIFLAAATVAISDISMHDVQQADSCPAGRYASVDYADQRPGAPKTQKANACA